MAKNFPFDERCDYKHPKVNGLQKDELKGVHTESH